MNRQKNDTINKICVLLGASLLIIAAVLLLSWQWVIGSSVRQMEADVDTLRSLIPSPQNAIPEERRDNTMSTLSAAGTDFVGIIEFPRFESSLPVCANWGNINKHPCLFGGSVYDRTLKIGATTQKGQYDFYRSLSVGDTLYLTDMEGNRFSYSITDIKYSKKADSEALTRKKSSLTLFIKNIYSFEYIILYCN